MPERNRIGLKAVPELTDFNPKPAERQDILMTRKAEIVFEVEETVVVRRTGKIVAEYCPRCDQLVDMLSPDVLASIAGASEREIFRLLEAGVIHFVETEHVYACPKCYKRVLLESEVSKINLAKVENYNEREQGPE
jgi:hypothetical protein